MPDFCVSCPQCGFRFLVSPFRLFLSPLECLRLYPFLTQLCWNLGSWLPSLLPPGGPVVIRWSEHIGVQVFSI